MKKIIIKSVVLIGILAIALIALSGCQNNSENNSSNDNTTVAKVADADGYVEYSGSIDAKFKYPVTWQSVGTETQPVFMSSDNTGTSVNVSSAKYPESLSFETFMEVSKSGILETMTVEGEIQQQKIELNGREAYRLDYVATQDENMKVNITQVVFIDDGKVYILTAAADTNSYESVKDTLEAIISTFSK